MTLKLTEARNARLEDEVNRLRAAMLARLTIQEGLPADASVESLWLAIELTNDRLAAALYPASAKADGEEAAA